MIHVIIGPSGAGKTTYTKQRWFNGSFLSREAPVPHMFQPSTNLILLGRYGVGRRCEGTDALSYSIGPRLREVLRGFADREIVMEGDRITNAKTLEAVIRTGRGFSLYLVTAPLETCLLRLRKAGSKITPKFVKATRTKSHRLFARYASKADHAEIVKT